MMRPFFPALALISLALVFELSCTPTPSTQDAGVDASFFIDREICERTYTGFPATVGNVDDDLVEVSGIIASPTTSGVLWAHADNGNEPLVSALNHEGQTLARFRPQQVVAEDMEDIAAALCPDEGLDADFCLYLADTGNNSGEREDLGVVVFGEPEVDPSAEPLGNVSVFNVKRFPIRYPNDEGIDCEAMVVSPQGDAIYFFEKHDEPSARLFKMSAPFSETDNLLVEVAEITTPGVDVEMGKMITAADLHPSGSRLLMRVYTGVFEYRFAEGEGLEDIEDVTATTVTFGPFSEPQGEALSYDETGLNLWSVSEDPDGISGQPLHYYSCE